VIRSKAMRLKFAMSAMVCRISWVALLAPLLVLIILALASCSGSDSDSSGFSDPSGSTVEDEPTEQDPAGPSSSDSAEFDAPLTIEDLENQWAETRADLIESLNTEIAAGRYGVDSNNVLHGPAQFELDLTTCPSGWSETAGVTDQSITIGLTTAQSGLGAVFGDAATGLGFYLDEVNTDGGIDGRQVDLMIDDDSYEPGQTASLVAERLATDEAFSITTMGTSTSLTVYDALNSACVPQPFVMSTHPAWGDPSEHPWTVGLPLSAATEPIIWGEWIGENLAADLPVTVGTISLANDSGLPLADTFADWAGEHPEVIDSVVSVEHSSVGGSLDSYVATLAEAEPDVVIIMTVDRFCIPVINAVSAIGPATSSLDTTDGLNQDNGSEAGASDVSDPDGVEVGEDSSLSLKARILSSACADESLYLGPAGEAADGLLAVDGGLLTLDVSNSGLGSDPVESPAVERGGLSEPNAVWLNHMQERLAEEGLDAPSDLLVSGYGLLGWAQVEALRIAAELDGGLTRSNLLLALRALDLVHPMLVEGISFQTNGLDDAYPIEGATLTAFDAETGQWAPDGDLIDANGQSSTCSWQENSCR